MAFDCSSEKPSALRRWTNFRVSKWWSRDSFEAAEKPLLKLVEGVEDREVSEDGRRSEDVGVGFCHAVAADVKDR